MRRLIPTLLLCLAWSAYAEETKPRPKDLMPVPAHPAGAELSPELEPQVTILKRGEEKVEEYRINGRFYMMKVTPAIGKPYYLIDDQGDGKFAKHDSLDSGVRVPQWVLFNF